LAFDEALFTWSFNLKSNICKLVLSSSIVLSGCGGSSDDSNDGIACTDQSVPAITIEIVDKGTGGFIACGATAIIEDTGFSEEVTNQTYNDCENTELFQAAHERSGIYNVHIYKAGYLDWSMYNIEVTFDVCHVSTVHLIAELEK